MFCNLKGRRLPSEFLLQTVNLFTSCHLTKNDILRIINNLDPNKAQDYHKINIYMSKICGNSICRPLKVIFRTYLYIAKPPLE